MNKLYSMNYLCQKTNVIKKQGHLFSFEDNWWHNQNKFKSFSFLHFKTVFYTQKDEYFHLAQDSPNNDINKFLGKGL